MANSMNAIMLIVIYVLKTTLASSHVDECLMLLQIKKTMSLNDTASFNSHAYPKVASWSKGMNDCCLWDGVECSSGHVTGLDLSSSYLYGPIFSNNSLFDVVHLRRLNLADNNFSFSQVLSGIGRLSLLKNLNLSYLSFSGLVPKEISYLTQLVSLDLTENQLNLQSPGFRNLVRNSSKTLKKLFLSDVDINYEIPDILANAYSLTSLVLRDCGLTGYFPLGIFDLPTLQHLDVQDNYELSGYFTEFHGNSQLKDLIIRGTKFQGELPASIGNLIHLNQLNLYGCSFNGPLPVSVSNLIQLTVLDLGYNNFDTSNCDLLGKFPNLSYLDLSGVGS